jgi:hypothetical protein
MSLVDTLSKMSFFFTLVQMHALEDLVRKNKKQIQTIWEETVKDHGQTSIVKA